MKMKEWEEGMRASRALQAAAFKNKLGEREREREIVRVMDYVCAYV